MTDKLLPCPFCGSRAELASYVSCDCCGAPFNGRVRCTQCRAEIGHRDSDAEAISAWNTRTNPKLDIAVEAIKTSMTALDDWIHVHAPQECSEESVEETMVRIREHGTIGYIATVQQQNRDALERIKETNNG